MKNLPILFLAFLVCTLSAAGQKNWEDKTEKAAYIHRSVQEITDVMVHDIYSPPVTSRIYAYSCIAGYEAAVAGAKDYATFAGQLHGLGPLPAPRSNQEYSVTLASVCAMLSVTKALVISEETVKLFQDSLLKEFTNAGIPENIFNNSIAYGQKVAEHILKWASMDQYKETRSLPKYAVTDEVTWKPTPPSYMKAVEPHWNRMRTFVIDSAQQFKPLPATPYSHESGSQFYKEAAAVQMIGLNLSEEQKAIANFWDCNPFKMNINGHVMYATKKISPGGHWMNIAKLSCQKTNAGIIRSLETYACLSITIADAFISCWDEKYRSRVVRPETYINQYIDGNWMPLLQTPPFPEYTSGHSVLSAAAAQLLTKIFGEHFAFTDSTELSFGLPPRSFSSFKQAAAEAAISRFYGGIHYMPSIVNGATEGEKIGKFIIEKLRTRKEYPLVKELPKKPVHSADAPMYRDPITDGAADPVVVYNRKEKSWWMLYTQRRANTDGADVAYCYGTAIGVASSTDHGKTWVYRGVLPLAIEKGENTFWAPDIVWHNGAYHMFVAYIQGVRNHWGGHARLAHYTGKNLWDWKFEGFLQLTSENVIDPTLMQMPDGKWRMWYKDEGKGAVTMMAESMDLFHWKLHEHPAIGGQPHEGPKAFHFAGYYWMLTDEWSGMRVYRSNDADNWERQGKILDTPSSRREDGPTGAHGDVVVVGNKAYVIYFTHPERKTHSEAPADASGVIPYRLRRSSIQVAELVLSGSTLICNREEPFEFYLPQ